MLKAAAVPPIKWGAPDSAGILDFLVREKEFSEDRVRKGIERINAAKGKSSQVGDERRGGRAACDTHRVQRPPTRL